MKDEPGYNHLGLDLRCNHTTTLSTTSFPSPAQLGQDYPPPSLWWTAQVQGLEVRLCTPGLHHPVEVESVVLAIQGAEEEEDPSSSSVPPQGNLE